MPKQLWKKLGLIYDGTQIPNISYASVPISILINENNLRIFFSGRNPLNNSIPFYLDYDLIEKKILKIEKKPLLELGPLGAFDDSGIMPTCMVEMGNSELWMYYIGWNLGVTVPFRNSLGLACSKDNGVTFTKKYTGPILDRNKNEPYFNASCCIMVEDMTWKIWYLSCTKWEIEASKSKHHYHIKYAESKNGIDWERNGIIAIDFEHVHEYAISVPRVIKENDIYKMWYSYRGNGEITTYRIGYAESIDGINWTRKDEEVGIDVSEEGWDSEMICYPFIFDHNNNRYMLYNGNGYGKTGFGIAQLI